MTQTLLAVFIKIGSCCPHRLTQYFQNHFLVWATEYIPRREEAPVTVRTAPFPWEQKGAPGKALHVPGEGALPSFTEPRAQNKCDARHHLGPLPSCLTPGPDPALLTLTLLTHPRDGTLNSILWKRSRDPEKLSMQPKLTEPGGRRTQRLPLDSTLVAMVHGGQEIQTFQGTGAVAKYPGSGLSWTSPGKPTIEATDLRTEMSGPGMLY